MNPDLEKAEQGLANEFNEKLDVTATPVVPAAESASFSPEAPVVPAPELPAPDATPAPDAPVAS